MTRCPLPHPHATRHIGIPRTTEYAAGVLDVSELIRSVPGLEAVARIRGEQVANIDSSHMTNDVLLKLADNPHHQRGRLSIPGPRSPGPDP